jgi:hypothetical protein
MSKDDGRRGMWLVVGATLAAGFALFVYGFAARVAPYFPRFFDQAMGSYAGLYRAHDALTAPDLTIAARVDAALPTLLDLRGWTVPWIATALGLAFGASRLVFASTNYVILAIVVMVLAAGLARHCAKWIVGAGIGLMLTSRSLLMPIGGLQDLRMDFAGLAMFGVFVVALWLMAETPNRRHVALAALAYAASLWSRSVTGVYGLVTIGVFGVVALTVCLAGGDPAWRVRWRMALALGLLAAPIFALYFALHFRAIDGYYFNLLRTDEARIRLAEFGLSSRAELLGYYLRSAWSHFRPMALLFATALGLAIATITIGRLRGARAGSVAPALIPAVAVVVSATTGVLLPLSVFSPSPVVIGVLSVPFATLGAVLLAAATARIPWPAVSNAIAILPLAVGLWACGHTLVAPPVWADSELTTARAHNDLYARLAADGGGVIAWMTVTEGANWAAFTIYLYESGRAADVPRFQQTDTAIFAMDAEMARVRITAADAVVIWRSFPPGALYPSIASLRDTREVWQPVLDHDFALRFEFAMSGGTIAYYRRLAPRAAGDPAPSGDNLTLESGSTRPTCALGRTIAKQACDSIQ